MAAQNSVQSAVISTQGDASCEAATSCSVGNGPSVEAVRPVDVLATLNTEIALLSRLSGKVARRRVGYLRDSLDAVTELVSAGKALSFAAQISGGVAGRDEPLCAAIDRFSAAIARIATDSPKGERNG